MLYIPIFTDCNNNNRDDDFNIQVVNYFLIFELVIILTKLDEFWINLTFELFLEDDSYICG